MVRYEQVKCILSELTTGRQMFIDMDLRFLSFSYEFLRQGLAVALETALKLALVDHVGLKLTEIRWTLLPECWN